MKMDIRKNLNKYNKIKYFQMTWKILDIIHRSLPTQ